MPVLVAEAAALGAAEMAEAASQCAFVPDEDGLPGLRAPAPPAYADVLSATLSEPLAALFGWKDACFEVLSSRFSLVTTLPDDLAPIQRIPSFHGTDPDIVVVQHDLRDVGSTAFHRHRVTGYERITQERLSRYDEVLRADARTHGLPDAAYVDGDTPIFAETARIEAAFGRLVAYPGNALHSGCIPAGAALTDDPGTGRLTVNTFLCVV